MEDLQQAVPVLDKQSLKEDCKKLSRLHFEDETFIETLERLSHVVHPMLKRGERQYLNWGGVMSHIKNSNNFISVLITKLFDKTGIFSRTMLDKIKNGRDTVVCIVYHNDADGMGAAAIMEQTINDIAFGNDVKIILIPYFHGMDLSLEMNKRLKRTDISNTITIGLDVSPSKLVNEFMAFSQYSVFIDHHGVHSNDIENDNKLEWLYRKLGYKDFSIVSTNQYSSVYNAYAATAQYRKTQFNEVAAQIISAIDNFTLVHNRLDLQSSMMKAGVYLSSYMKAQLPTNLTDIKMLYDILVDEESLFYVLDVGREINRLDIIKSDLLINKTTTYRANIDELKVVCYTADIRCAKQVSDADILIKISGMNDQTTIAVTVSMRKGCSKLNFAKYLKDVRVVGRANRLNFKYKKDNIEPLWNEMHDTKEFSEIDFSINSFNKTPIGFNKDACMMFQCICTAFKLSK